MDINFDPLQVEEYAEFSRGTKLKKLRGIVGNGATRIKLASKESGIVTFLKIVDDKITIVQTHRPVLKKVIWRVTKVTTQQFWMK